MDELKALDPVHRYRLAVREWLQELRRRRGQNQRDFAVSLNVKQQRIATWETGRHIPSPIYRHVLNVLARDVSMQPLPAPPPEYRDYRGEGERHAA